MIVCPTRGQKVKVYPATQEAVILYANLGQKNKTSELCRLSKTIVFAPMHR